MPYLPPPEDRDGYLDHLACRGVNQSVTFAGWLMAAFLVVVGVVAVIHSL